MSGLPAVPGDASPALRKAHFTETALALDPEISFEEWEQVGAFVFRVGKSWRWWVGDWIAHGEHAYGETYAQAIELTGFDYQTLADAHWVAKAVPVSRRREGVTWSHHKEIAGLPPNEQRHFLAEAEKNNWKRDELRLAIRSETGEPPEPSQPEVLPANGQVKCPSCGALFSPEEAL